MKKTLVEELREESKVFGLVSAVQNITGKSSYQTGELLNALADRIEKEYLPRPRFEDGEPVQFGDKAAFNNSKLVITVDSITYNKGGTFVLKNGIGSGFISAKNEIVKRPKPEPEPTFDWKAFKHGGVAVQCKTEELAKDFLKQAEEQGYTWPLGSKPTSHTNWEEYGKKTCYTRNYSHVIYGCKKFLKKQGYTIVKWGDDGR